MSGFDVRIVLHYRPETVSTKDAYTLINRCPITVIFTFDIHSDQIEEIPLATLSFLVLAKL